MGIIWKRHIRRPRRTATSAGKWLGFGAVKTLRGDRLSTRKERLGCERYGEGGETWSRWLMGGGTGGMELSLSSSLQAASIPPPVLQALRALDQELGEETEREALDGVVDSLVEWFLSDSRTPRTGDGGLVGVICRWSRDRCRTMLNVGKRLRWKQGTNHARCSGAAGGRGELYRFC